MEKNELNFKDDLPNEGVFIINNIRFTPREIDILVCLLKARSTKKIASLLSIEPKTVRNHIHNIMTKIGCNSRYSIIDFIERSEKLSLLKNHYANLMIKVTFEQSLKEISKMKREIGPPCKLIYWTETSPSNLLISQLQVHLKLVGINVSLELRKDKPTFFELLSQPQKESYEIYILPQFLVESFEEDSLVKNKVLSLLSQNNYSAHRLFLLLENNFCSEIYKHELPHLFLDLSSQENYFFAFFLVLKQLLPNLDLSKTIEEFKDKYKKEPTEYKRSQIAQNEKSSGNRSIHGKRFFFFLACALIVLIGGGFLAFDWHQTNNDKIILRSDLVIPVESAFLNRPELIAQIDDGFKGKKGIQTTAIVGIGGSGKTTLARQYAHQQKASLIWEINAETNRTLIESFGNLASTLARTEDDKRTLRDLTEIKDSSKRETKIVEFVKARLKLQPNWFLIYDNVEKFADIQKYFPLDQETWGQGKIILTTRDSNLQNNKYISHTLQIGELNENEKLNLFAKVMNQDTKNSFTSAQRAEAQKFLRAIPSFPLDVSIAAYYLKVTNISYKKYLENLQTYNHEFAAVQENLLREAGTYIKTRYGIIILSLEEMIKSHIDFGELLLFIALLDSQNIPRGLLNNYKSDAIVDNFIYHLKKYSLITSEASTSPTEPTLSIHRSTQDISFAYLTKLLKIHQESQVVKGMINTLDDYVDQVIEQEDFPRMRLMALHLEKLLHHTNLLTNFSKGLLESKLGSIYYFINDDKSKKLLDSSLNILKIKNLEQIPVEDESNLARALLHIGAIYTELRLYKEAEELFKKAINIYKQGVIKNDIDLALAFSHLGDIYRRLGDYEIARDYLEQSVQLNKKTGGNKQRTARTLGYLGSVYRGLGLYQKSIDTLEESLVIYHKNYSNDHFRIGWTLTRLGNVYSDLGNFKKAKQYFEDGLFISKKYFPEDHLSMSLTLTYLGNCYRELGDYEKSRDFLEQSLKIHQKYFDETQRRMGWILFHLGTTYETLGNHQEAQKLYDKALKIYAKHCIEDNIKTARLLRDMARISLAKNQLDDAESLIKRSLKILQTHNHPDVYRSLEVLGDIYLTRYLQPGSNSVAAQSSNVQALDAFHQGLQIIENNFPKNSIHIKRIKSKINSMQK